MHDDIIVNVVMMMSSTMMSSCTLAIEHEIGLGNMGESSAVTATVHGVCLMMLKLIWLVKTAIT